MNFYIAEPVTRLPLFNFLVRYIFTEVLYNQERAFSRLLIIDSPLCTKYGDKIVAEDKVALGTIDAFAKYCDTKEWNFQFIVIDNKFTEKIDINDLTNINFIDLESQGGLFVHN